MTTRTRLQVDQEDQVVLNSATRRLQYSGSVLKMAKAVGDAAHGGQVLMTAEAMRMCSSWLQQNPDVLIFDEGRQQLLPGLG